MPYNFAFESFHINIVAIVDIYTFVMPPTTANYCVKTLRTQDTSDPRHFGTIRLVPKCPDSSALVPKCLDLKHTFLIYLNLYVYNIAHLLLSSGVCV